MHRFPQDSSSACSRGLPLRVLHALGTVLGWTIVWDVAHLSTASAATNLAPPATRSAHASRRDRSRRADDHGDCRRSGCVRRTRSPRWCSEAVGVEAALRRARAGKALLFLTPHMGCFEVAAQYASQARADHRALSRAEDALARAADARGRGRGDVRLRPADLAGVREMFAALKRARGGRLPSRPGAGHRRGRVGDFFGRPAYTMTLAREARRARRHRLLPRFRAAPAARRGLFDRVRPLPEALAGRKRATRRINRALEALVRECPEQYLWGYNRYKTPRGAKPRPHDDAGWSSASCGWCAACRFACSLRSAMPSARRCSG